MHTAKITLPALFIAKARVVSLRYVLQADRFRIFIDFYYQAYKQLLANAPLSVPGSDEVITSSAIQFNVASQFESQGMDFPFFFEQLNTSLTGDGSAFAGGSLNIAAVAAIILECGDNSMLSFFYNQ
jgi:hypothetical protein